MEEGNSLKSLQLSNDDTDSGKKDNVCDTYLQKVSYMRVIRGPERQSRVDCSSPLS